MQGKWFSYIRTLLQDADSTLATVTDDSVIAHILAKNGTVSNYDDTTDSLEALSIAIGGGSTSNVPQFTGTIYYVDGSQSDDTGDGLSPANAKKTIGAAITAASAGDAVTIKAGTYVEDVVMSKASMQLWPENGVILDGTGTCLTISGGTCYIKGQLDITPAADHVGVAITTLGMNILEDVRVRGTASTCGFDIDTTANILRRCKVAGIKAGGKAYDIGNSQNVLDYCSTAGSAASYGYYVDGAGIISGKLSHCTSSGHTESGFYLDEISGMSVIGCSSGAGDGNRVDVDDANVWSNFSYDNEVYKENTLSITGANSAAYNLFRVHGIVKILALGGHVETALTGTNTNAFIEVWSANGQADLSKDSTCTLGALGVGSAIMKLDKTDKILSIGDATTGPFVVDQIDAKEEGFRLGEDHTGGVAVATYIRFNHTCSAGGTGKIHWHCVWEPVNECGFVEAA